MASTSITPPTHAREESCPRARLPTPNPTHQPILTCSCLHQVDDEDEEQALCEHLGVDCLPTVQFWRDGALLWEHRGVSAMEQELGEGEAPGRGEWAVLGLAGGVGDHTKVQL